MVANKLFRLALFMVTFKHGNIFIHRIWKADCVPSIRQNFEYGFGYLQHYETVIMKIKWNF